MKINLTALHTDLLALNRQLQACLPGHIGIRLSAIGPTWLAGEMPVDQRTKQPYGLLHGGASVVLAETLGSFAAALVVGPDNRRAVGIEVNANHVRSATSGVVVGITRPDHIGRSLHVWSTRIFRPDGRLISVARLTVSVIPGPEHSPESDR